MSRPSTSPRLRLASFVQPPKVDAMQDLPEVEAYESHVQTVLRAMPTFAGVRRASLLEAEELGVQVFEVDAGERLIVEGEFDRSMMIIARGRAQVLASGSERAVADVYPGELLGEAGYYGRSGRRLAGVRSATPCTLVVFSMATLHKLRALCNPVVDAVEFVAMRMLAKRAHLAQRQRDAQAPAARSAGVFARLLDAYTPRARTARPSQGDVLRACPGLRHLSGRAWRAIAESALMVELAPGERLTVDRAFAVVVSGELERVVRHGRVSERYSAGELVGLGGLAYPVRDGASLRARGEAWVLCVSYARLERRMKADADLAKELRMLVAEQLVEEMAPRAAAAAA